MKKLLLLVIISFSGICLNAQTNLDSLYAVWQDETLADTTRANAYKQYIWNGYLFTDPDTVFILARSLLRFSEDRELDEVTAWVYNVMGVADRQRANYPRALDYFQRSLKVKEEIGDKVGSAGAICNIGVIYEEIGDYPKALDHYQRSFKSFEELGKKDQSAKIILNIGGIYARQRDFPKALEYFQRSLKLFEEVGNKMTSAAVICNIGSIYQDLMDYPMALEEYEQSLKIYDEIGDKQGTALVISNIGNNYSKQKDYAKALEFFERSLKIRVESGNKKGIASTLHSIGNSYKNQGTNTKAVEYCKRALVTAQEIGALDVEKEACECLYETYKAMGKGNNALVYLERIIVIDDSLSMEETDKLLQQMEFDKQLLADSLQYVAELAQVENERTVAEIRADKNRNKALATGGGALLLIAGGSAWFYSDRKRRKERFEKEAATLETQALRSQMNPHFIFNALNSINAFVQKNDPDNATSFLTKFARVMRSVLENSRHSEVPLKDDLETLRGYMDLERKRMNEKFDFTIEVDPAIDPEEVMVPPLVVQPFVENAIWHGMKGREDKGHITLSVKQQGQQLVWQIEDDGVGRQAKTEPLPGSTLGQPVKKTSLGTAITRSRLDLVQKQHGGKAGFRYEDLARGTRVIVEMPLLLG